MHHQRLLFMISALGQMLTKYELATLSDMLGSELYEAGEDIVKQGLSCKPA